jgi:hypothetical protein
MPKPLPDQASADLTAPDAAEVELISRGVVTAVTPSGGLTETQLLLLRAVFVAMTGFPATVGAPELDPGGLAEGLARRTIEFRTRIVQIMILLGLVLRPIPVEVADRITAYARELCVEDGMLEVARSFAEGSLELAALDFDRNGYTSTRDAGATSALHTSRRLDSAWDLDLADDSLAERWQSLERYADNSLGRRLTDFYRARGFTYPGRPGSAPPFLAQHDWVHVLADYGTTVEAELEVFAFIARANDDLRAFSLLAMVVSLFETGYLRAGAGLFESDPGHLFMRAWRHGLPTPCVGVLSVTAASISWASTGSIWPPFRLTRPAATSGCPRSLSTRSDRDRSAPGNREASAPSRFGPGRRSQSRRAAPTSRSAPSSPQSQGRKGTSSPPTTSVPEKRGERRSRLNPLGALSEPW